MAYAKPVCVCTVETTDVTIRLYRFDQFRLDFSRSTIRSRFDSVSIFYDLHTSIDPTRFVCGRMGTAVLRCWPPTVSNPLSDVRTSPTLVNIPTCLHAYNTRDVDNRCMRPPYGVTHGKGRGEIGSWPRGCYRSTLRCISCQSASSQLSN